MNSQSTRIKLFRPAFRRNATIFRLLFLLAATSPIIAFFAFCKWQVEAKRPSDTMASQIKLSENKSFDHLKQIGEYEALKDAFYSARQNDIYPLAARASAIYSTILTASDGNAGDWLGVSVAISGDTAIVGADMADINGNTDQGAAYIFVKNGSNWVLQQKLFAGDGGAGEIFGRSVAIEGDTAVVTAMWDTVNANVNQGSAYVYIRSGATWTLQAKLTAFDGVAGDWFGHSVAISENTIIVGAFLKNGAAAEQGAAYVFVRNQASWSQQAKLIDSNGLPAEQFGVSVAISGNTAIIGAYQNSINGKLYCGSAFVFTRRGITWTLEAMLTANDGLAGDRFGIGVAISGNFAIIGAYQSDHNGKTNAGSAYVFTRTGSAWTQEQKLLSDNPESDGWFGISVAILNDTVIIGSPLADTDGYTDQGSAYIFKRNNSLWTQKAKLVSNSGASGHWFGYCAAVSGDRIIIGAYYSDVGANSNQGKAYIFDMAGVGFTPFDFDADGRADISVFRPSNGVWYLQRSQAGYTSVTLGAASDVVSPADFDGDGKTDIAIFSPVTGIWNVLRSSDSSIYTIQFGQDADLPRPTDFDGDGKADITVYRPQGGVWYWVNSSNAQFNAIQFGAAADNPVIADFDGDGKNDLSVFRPSTGDWYWIKSSNGQLSIVNFGLTGDMPVTADYDGDGKTDISVFRPSSSDWYRINSGSGLQSGIHFGQSGDVPAAADYDGDGKSDIAIFRPSTGTWYILQSQAGYIISTFGLNGDKPLPNAFVQ